MQVLEELLGKYITFYCVNYIYAGVVKKVTENILTLSDCSIVYNTGSHDLEQWADAKKFKGDWHIALQSIESFGEFKCG